MEIYYKGKLVKKVKRFIAKRDKALFLALRGINIEGEGDTIYVDEIYMPLLTISLEGSVLFIDVARPDGDFTTVILHTRFPFIYVGRGKADFKDEER